MKNQPSVEPDKDTREAFVARYKGPLRSYFAKRINQFEDIDDLVQEVFGRVWASGSEGRLKNADGYIFQAASNLLKERFRKQSTKDAAVADLPFFHQTVEDITPERILQAKDELRQLERALAELPSRTRTVFLLHRFEGLKYREISERIGVSVSSVEKHIAAAARHITKRLDRQ